MGFRLDKIAFLFSGQGSQYIGMGKDLYSAFPESQAIFDKADEILGYSISKICFEGPEVELTKTQNCQPAVLVVSIAALAAFKATFKQKMPDVSYVAGLSLGEYSALVAAQCLNFEDAVYLVRRRGEFMEETAAKIPGKMLSLIGFDLEKVRKICSETNSEIANINSPGQIVISGGEKEIMEAKKIAEDRGVRRAIILAVSGAFHSSLMKEASLKLVRELERITITSPKIPVISNVTAKPVSGPIEIKENLIKQVASSVLWEDSMRFILSKGIKKYLEFGPGRVLKGLMRRIDETAEVSSLEKKEDILNLKP